MPTKRHLPVDSCEICKFADLAAIQAHHMIPRTDAKCTDDMGNLAYVCANCHNLIHANLIIMEGRYLTTLGFKLFWHKAGEPHIVIPGIILNPDGTATVIKD